MSIPRYVFWQIWRTQIKYLYDCNPKTSYMANSKDTDKPIPLYYVYPKICNVANGEDSD